MAAARGRHPGMTYWIVCGTLAVIGLGGIGALSLGLTRRLGVPPDTIEARGPFEIVTRHRHDDVYAVRYQGKAFSFDGKSGMYGDGVAHYEWMNSAITFDRTTPAVLVNVGDPNNSGFFYLLREVDGKAEATYLGPSRGGVSADWLDAPPESARQTRDITLHRGDLAGGRWLLLGDSTVFDTRTFRAYALPETTEVFYQPWKRPLALSPDERSFVRLASRSGDAPVLAVVDFVEGAISVLPIDRRTMRYHDWEEIDGAWVAHHFEWRRDRDGHDRLVERAGFAPLPYRGLLTRRSSDGYREYKLPRATRALHDALVAFIVKEWHATPRPVEPEAETRELEVGAQIVNVSFYGEEPSVWMSSGARSRLVAEIAARFDSLLATGRYDQEFAPAESSDP